MINLLPPKEKEYLVYKKKERLVIVLGFMSIIALVSFMMVLYALKFYMLREVISQRNILSDVEYLHKDADVSSYENLIKKYNRESSRADTFYQNESYVTFVLDTLSAVNLPQGVYFTSIKVEKSKDTSGYMVTISGTSNTRDNLILFKDNIEKNGKIKNINFSPDSWIKPKDVNFGVTLEVVQ